MAKKTVNPKKVEAPSKFGHSKPETQAKHPGPRAFLPSKYTSGILVLLLFVIISLIYFPVAYQQKFPQASDITQWEGAARKIIDYNQEHSDRALWTPNMFFRHAFLYDLISQSFPLSGRHNQADGQAHQLAHLPALFWRNGDLYPAPFP
jgi:hypothetical protein